MCREHWDPLPFRDLLPWRSYSGETARKSSLVDSSRCGRKRNCSESDIFGGGGESVVLRVICKEASEDIARDVSSSSVL